MSWLKKSFLKGRKRPPNLWLSMMACLACLALLTVLIADLFAADESESAVPPSL